MLSIEYTAASSFTINDEQDPLFSIETNAEEKDEAHSIAGTLKPGNEESPRSHSTRETEQSSFFSYCEEGDTESGEECESDSEDDSNYDSDDDADYDSDSDDEDHTDQFDSGIDDFDSCTQPVPSTKRSLVVHLISWLWMKLLAIARTLAPKLSTQKPLDAPKEQKYQYEWQRELAEIERKTHKRFKRWKKRREERHRRFLEDSRRTREEIRTSLEKMEVCEDDDIPEDTTYQLPMHGFSLDEKLDVMLLIEERQEAALRDPIIKQLYDKSGEIMSFGGHDGTYEYPFAVSDRVKEYFESKYLYIKKTRTGGE